MKTLSKSTTTAASLWFKSLLGDCQFLKSSRNIKTFLPEGPKNHRIFFKVHVLSNHVISRLLIHFSYGPSGEPEKNHVISRITLYQDSLSRRDCN